MDEKSLRRIVEEVVRVLARKGYLKPGCGCERPAAEPAPRAVTSAPRVTVGTAGKVFSDEWRLGTGAAGGEARGRPPGAPAEGPRRAAPAGPAGELEHEHTGLSSCPQCGPLASLSGSELKAIGCDRIGVCHPTKKGSPVGRYVDHTLLKPNATQEEIAKLCEEARAFCFASVCVNPSYVALASGFLKGSGVKVCTVVGFPLGSTTPTVKAIEARDAIANGADEIDMVINVGALKSANDAAVFDDMRAVREATRGHVLKAILETSLLSDEEKVRACALAKKAGADFVKTSTGFGGGGATVEDIRLMRQAVGPLMGVKASGGIRDAKAARAMIEAGATRLGTSASVAIVTDQAAEGKGY